MQINDQATACYYDLVSINADTKYSNISWQTGMAIAECNNVIPLAGTLATSYSCTQA